MSTKQAQTKDDIRTLGRFKKPGARRSHQHSKFRLRYRAITRCAKSIKWIQSIHASSVAEDEEVAVANTLQSMHRRSAKAAPAETKTLSFKLYRFNSLPNTEN